MRIHKPKGVYQAKKENQVKCTLLSTAKDMQTTSDEENIETTEETPTTFPQIPGFLKEERGREGGGREASLLAS